MGLEDVRTGIEIYHLQWARSIVPSSIVHSPLPFNEICGISQILIMIA